MSYRTYFLGDILKRRKSIENILPNKLYKLVTIKLYHKGVILRKEVKGAEIGSTMFSLKEGDFVLSGIDARNGAFGIVPNYLDGAIITNDFWCLEPDENIIDKEFLLYLTNTNFFDYICKQSSDGTTQRIRLQKDKFFGYKIDLPLIGEQRKILLKLKSFSINSECLTFELTRQQELIKQLRQAFLSEAMQGKLVKQNKKDGNAIELLQKIKSKKEKLIVEKKCKVGKALPPINKEDIPFNIPESWVWCKLGDIAEIVRGGSPRPAGDKTYYDGSIPFLKVGDLTGYEDIYCRTHTFTIKEAGLNKTRFVEADTLMLTNSGATLGIPRICTFPTTFNDGIAAFLNLNFIDKIYLYFFLKSRSNWFLKQASRGQGQPNLNTDIIADTLFPLPTLPEQNRIAKKVRHLMQLCDELQQNIEQNKTENGQLLQAFLKETLSKEAVTI